MSSINTTALKRTTSANGKHYYYEKTNSNEENSYWSRIDKGFYDFLINKNSKGAIQINKDDDGNVIFFEYKSEGLKHFKTTTSKRLVDGEVVTTVNMKPKTGCILSIPFVVLVIIVLYINF